MTRPHPFDPMPAPDVLEAAAALADHLGRAGVAWLPRPRAESLATIQSQLIRPAEAIGPSDPDEPAASTPSTRDPVAPASRSNSGPAVEASTHRAGPSGSPPAGTARPVQRPGRLSTVAAVHRSEGPYPGADLAAEQRRAQLAAMASEVARCTRCPALVACRKQTVFGEGHESPRVAFFGEGPGSEEDRTGRPFVGKAGQLLTKMIEACTFRREDVYILNTVKCRPPGNRNPEPQEIANCREYFERQFAILRPEYIVCLGAISSQALLGSKLSVGRLRGTLHRYFDSKVVVTYHPAYLLRNPAAKKAAWEDLQIMLRDAGILS